MKLAGAVGLGLLASVVLWIAPAAVSAQCKPGDILVGEDADNAGVASSP